MTEQNGRPMTEGEYRVGVTFNPSSLPAVDALKKAGAALIDQCLAVKKAALDTSNPEAAFQADRAARSIEDATMNAVKAATKQPVPSHLEFPR